MEQNNKSIQTGLLSHVRSNIVTQEHFGYIKVIGNKKVLYSIGEDFEMKIFHRSCAKPLQASLLIDMDLINYFHLTTEEIAISTSSHCGTNEHTKIVNEFLQKIGLNASALKCGIHQPLSLEAKNALLLTNKEPNTLQNNCSGKHTFMLAACIKNSYNIDNYYESKHPLQQKILAKIKSLTEANYDLPMTQDGCGVPIWGTTLFELGNGYINLFTNPKYVQIKNAFLKFPYLIGGKDRLDSEIINANKNLIAKVGADGLCVVLNLKEKQALVVKITNTDNEARALITIFALLQLKWLHMNEIKNSNLKNLFKTEIKTLHGNIVGKIIPQFNISL